MQGFISHPARRRGADGNACDAILKPRKFRRVGCVRHHETRAATGEAVLQIITGEQRRRGDHHRAELHRRQHHLPQRHNIAEHEQNAVPALHTKRAQPIGDTVGGGGKLGKAYLRRAIADDFQRRVLTLRALGQFGIEPIQRPVEMGQFRPAEIAIGSRVIAALRQQEIPRGLEGGMAHAAILPAAPLGAAYFCSGKG